MYTCSPGSYAPLLALHRAPHEGHPHYLRNNGLMHGPTPNPCYSRLLQQQQQPSSSANRLTPTCKHFLHNGISLFHRKLKVSNESLKMDSLILYESTPLYILWKQIFVLFIDELLVSLHDFSFTWTLTAAFAWRFNFMTSLLFLLSFQIPTHIKGQLQHLWANKSNFFLMRNFCTVLRL